LEYCILSCFRLGHIHTQKNWAEKLFKIPHLYSDSNPNSNPSPSYLCLYFLTILSIFFHLLKHSTTHLSVCFPFLDNVLSLTSCDTHTWNVTCFSNFWLGHTWNITPFYTNNGDGQSPVMARPHDVTSHSLIHHKLWQILRHYSCTMAAPFSSIIPM
jgi:hypothetical protein